MDRRILKKVRRKRRKIGIRKRVYGTADRPRLTVFRSLRHTYAQLIDDSSGKTLAAASTLADKTAHGGNIEAAEAVGTAIAKAAAGSGFQQVSFDRNGFKYHGRVKALAEAARKAGLKF